jgi:hypothetical protein
MKGKADMSGIENNASRRRTLAKAMWSQFENSERKDKLDTLKPTPVIYVVAKFNQAQVAEYVEPFGTNGLGVQKAMHELLFVQNTPSPLHYGWRPPVKGMVGTNIYYEYPIRPVCIEDTYQYVVVKRFTSSVDHLKWLEFLESLRESFFLDKAVDVVSVMQYE